MRISAPVIFAAVAALLVTGLHFAGWFAPVIYPDSLGYMRAVELPGPWGQDRHPLYGSLVLGVDYMGLTRASLPALQLGLQVLSAFALMLAARFHGLEWRAALALGLAAIAGQTVVIWGNAMLPELPAVSLLILSLALVLMAMRERLFWPACLLLALVLGAAYTLRPIVAPAILLLPMLYLLLARMDNQGWRLMRMAAMVGLVTLPLLLQSAYRYREVGDFNLVSFGGIGSMGATAQMLTPDLVPRLPEALQPLALEVIAAKQRGIDGQTVMPLFRNSRGERSFQTTALDGFDMLSRNFDEILWGQLSVLWAPGESWVAFNRRMGELSAAIIRAAPERQLFWTAGATSRLVGRLFTYNVAFLLALAAFSLAALWNVSRHGAALAGASGRNWTVLVLIVVAWVGSTSALTVIAAFPALRYTDTGGLLLTALPLYGLFLALRKTKSKDPA